MACAATAQVWTCLALNSSGRQWWDDFAQSLKARRTYGVRRDLFGSPAARIPACLVERMLHERGGAVGSPSFIADAVFAGRLYRQGCDGRVAGVLGMGVGDRGGQDHP